MNLLKNISILLLSALVSCGGNKGGNESTLHPSSSDASTNVVVVDTNKIEINERDLLEIKEKLIEYSVKWNKEKNNDINKGILAGALLYELRFPELRATDTKYIFSELSKDRNLNADFTDVAKELFKRRQKK